MVMLLKVMHIKIVEKFMLKVLMNTWVFIMLLFSILLPKFPMDIILLEIANNLGINKSVVLFFILFFFSVYGNDLRKENWKICNLFWQRLKFFLKKSKISENWGWFQSNFRWFRWNQLFLLLLLPINVIFVKK